MPSIIELIDILRKKDEDNNGEKLLKEQQKRVEYTKQVEEQKQKMLQVVKNSNIEQFYEEINRRLLNGKANVVKELKSDYCYTYTTEGSGWDSSPTHTQSTATAAVCILRWAKNHKENNCIYFATNGDQIHIHGRVLPNNGTIRELGALGFIDINGHYRYDGIPALPLLTNTVSLTLEQQEIKNNTLEAIKNRIASSFHNLSRDEL